MQHDSRFWWERADRHYDAEGRFCFGGIEVSELVAQLGTPSYVYSAARVTQNVTRLRQAIADAGLDIRVLYAMKSNRFAPLLQHLRALGVGLDVCSPGEVAHALSLGFAERDLSFTAGCLSRDDHRALAAHPDLWVNVDSRTALRRWAELCPGRALGLRLNPHLGLGYADNDRVVYSAAKPTKFGIHPDEIQAAVDEAHALGLRVEALHCHAGCGYLDPQLDRLDRILGFIADQLDRLPGIRAVNLGGGLGIPLTAADRPLDLHRWTELVHRHFGHRPVELLIEPGDYLVKDAGVLLAEVTQVEDKAGVCFVGVNAGFNVHPEPAFYGLPLEAVPAVWREGPSRSVSIVGNINEALDVWAEGVTLSPVREDDTLCFLNAGGYGSAMSSQHCLRGGFKELMIEERPAEHLSPGVSMDELNRSAWERLYSSSDEAVWGADALPFLTDFDEAFRRALRAPSRLLDAGTGEGRNLSFLAQVGANEIHAMDASSAALGKIAADRYGNLHKHLGSLGQTPFEDAFFDGVILLDTFETLPDIDAVLDEMHRVLKPGGVLLCNVPGMDDGVSGLNMRALSDHAYLYRDRYYFRFFEPSEARALMERHGFEVLIERHVTWEEPPHPGFRDEFHEHTSHVFLIGKPSPSPDSAA
ncbi:MAG: methyltransferase domain-containing protein [Xanthomonadales bacterium]|nr:methyltransferase domain-containing protein [Xanthomonadales bacterium]